MSTPPDTASLSDQRLKGSDLPAFSVLTGGQINSNTKGRSFVSQSKPTPHNTAAHVQLYLGDCLEVMAAMSAGSVDAIVCDPPYGLEFMGRGWDHGVPGVPFWAEALRVLKPGGHLLAFGGTRTYHRLATAIEDAGFEIRDQLIWAYAQGFPKSHDVSKALGKQAGAGVDVAITAPATGAAQRWAGWGTALKPAHEPIVMARKPLIGTVAANVLKHGTGAINIHGTRIGVMSEADEDESKQKNRHGQKGNYNPPGRWPANVILTDPIFDGDVEGVVGGGISNGGAYPTRRGEPVSTAFGRNSKPTPGGARAMGDKGTYSRFFLIPKAGKKDRGEGNSHPTVKPRELMSHLVRLVCQPGGTVLDPFMGSGSTGLGAIAEGMSFIGIEREAEYMTIARTRLAHVERIAA